MGACSKLWSTVRAETLPQASGLGAVNPKSTWEPAGTPSARPPTRRVRSPHPGILASRMPTREAGTAHLDYQTG